MVKAKTKASMDDNIFWDSTPEEIKERKEALKNRDKRLAECKKEVEEVAEERNEALADMVDEFLLKGHTTESPYGLLLMGIELVKAITHPAELSPSARNKIQALSLEMALRYYKVLDDDEEAKRRAGKANREKDRKADMDKVRNLIELLQKNGAVQVVEMDGNGKPCDCNGDDDKEPQKAKSDPMFG